MKKYQNMLTACLCVIFVMTSSLTTPVKADAESVFSKGDGTQANPWVIETVAHLETLHSFLGMDHMDEYFSLANDLDLTATLEDTANGWNPIGTKEMPFLGSFDGKGHHIKGLWIDLPEQDNVGLFGYTELAEFKDLVIELDPEKGIVGKDYVGGLVGTIENARTLKSIVVIGSIQGANMVGGIVGKVHMTSSPSVFPEFIYSGTLTGKNEVGGIFESRFVKLIPTNSYTHHLKQNCEPIPHCVI